jgi:hypothetical protein
MINTFITVLLAIFLILAILWLVDVNVMVE